MESEAFGPEFGLHAGQARHVATWSAKTGNKTVLHWITAIVEHDWYRRSGSFGGSNWGGRVSSEYHRHVSIYEVRDE
jgi:hypothetical protein